MPCLLLIITILFTCGDTKIWSNIKMSQNIMTRIAESFLLSGHSERKVHIAIQRKIYFSLNLRVVT